jgi:hypothetical protein
LKQLRGQGQYQRHLAGRRGAERRHRLVNYAALRAQSSLWWLLLRMSKEEHKKLPPEQQEQVIKIKGAYAQ